MRFAMCNEHFDRPVEDAFALLADLGYDGVEVTPWTFTDDVTDLADESVARVRDAATRHGLDVVGVPRVFRAGEPYHVAAADDDTRDRTIAALRATVDCCAAIGGDVVVFGSPTQRNVPAGCSYERARERAVETFVDPDLLAALEAGGVTLCVEPLSPPHTDFVTTAAEAVAFAEAVDHPNVGVALDGYHLAADEPPGEAIRRAGPHLAHFHADNTEGRGPRHGTVDYDEVAAALRDVDYDGYLSLEVHADIFRDPGEPFEHDPAEIARDAVDFLRTVFPTSA